ncbi:hypothetical protein ACQPXB_22635 [Amycolatopsis sp. CA-161197]|uniref:hypothetical protein n=1 Tax=unclassified Amycolatopsis TaxID=2618356 RepID=UPI003455A8C7
MQTGDETEYVVEEFRPVRHDLLAAGLRGEAGDPHRMAGDPRLLATLRVDGEEIGVLALDQAARPAERLRALADFVQDLILENLRPAGHSVDWPRCPERTHAHPMVAALADGRPLWTCPLDADIAVPIGELAAST